MSVKEVVSRLDVPAALTLAGKTLEYARVAVVNNTAKDKIQAIAQQAVTGCKAHPGAAVLVGSGLFIVAAPAIVATPALAAAGFGAQGVGLGSAAAGIQSGLGSVVGGGVFATLQSAGAGGYGLPIVYGGVQALGGIIASSAAGVLALGTGKKP